MASVGALGLSILSGDIATGRYVFSLPKVSVFFERGSDEPGASDKAWINFPRIYSAEDIDAYLAANRLKVSRWSTDPETSDRYAVVDLPRLEATLVDAERGLYAITLAGVDQESLSAWARESGVRIVTHDAKTGQTLVQPLDWLAPTPATVTNTVVPAPTAAPTARPQTAAPPLPRAQRRRSRSSSPVLTERARGWWRPTERSGSPRRASRRQPPRPTAGHLRQAEDPRRNS